MITLLLILRAIFLFIAMTSTAANSFVIHFITSLSELEPSKEGTDLGYCGPSDRQLADDAFLISNVYNSRKFFRVFALC
jgi:hypothetical protein